MGKTHKKINLFLILICIIFSLTSCSSENVDRVNQSLESEISWEVTQSSAEKKSENSKKEKSDSSDEINALLEKTSDETYIIINDNVPYFKDEEITTVSFETYAPLDHLGRCTLAIACIGKDLMPKEDRGSIGQVKPTGWQISKYDFVDGKYLYNRCHLIGYQLSGENANERNLITGTRYMNVDGMLPFENMVADYVRSSGNHVMYRVTPYFKGDELLARGVHMEAYSVEDDGRGISFNVFVNNIQPGVIIDYSTGKNRLENENVNTPPEENKLTTVPKSEEGQNSVYILNTNTNKFHSETCSSADDIKAENKETYNGTRTWLIDNGYSPCGRCKP